MKGLDAQEFSSRLEGALTAWDALGDQRGLDVQDSFNCEVDAHVGTVRTRAWGRGQLVLVTARGALTARGAK